MRLRVDLIPKGDYRDVVVIIDVMRSCTVAPILFERGLADLYLSPSLRSARHLAKSRNLLLLGERRGLPLEGFNYGNSPAEFLQADLTGKSAVMVSENAPKSLLVAGQARHVFLGGLYNADAVVTRAFSVAQEEIALVCCGFGDLEDLDDTFAAGYLAGRAKQAHRQLDPKGATLMAISLLKAFPNPLDALWQSRAGHYLRTLNLESDIGVCALISMTDRVPELLETERVEAGRVFRFAPLTR